MRGTPWPLGAGVGDLAPIDHLGDDAQLHADAGDGCGLLRGEHAANVLGDPLGRDLVTLGDSGRELVGEPLVILAGLARALGLGARLGDAVVHLAQHLGGLGHVLHALDGDGESGGAGDGVLLGHDRPLSVSGG